MIAVAKAPSSAINGEREVRRRFSPIRTQIERSFVYRMWSRIMP